MTFRMRPLVAGLLLLVTVRDAWAQGPVILRDEARVMAAVRRWNRIAIDATGLDHTPVRPGEPRVFGHEIGPGRSSRAMAITHVAMLEAVNAAVPVFRSYVPVEPPARPVDLPIAIAQAAHDTLAALFPSQASSFFLALTEDLRGVAAGGALDDGRDLGRRAARAILDKTATDGATHAEPRLGVDHVTSDAPGHWRQDPVSLIPTALGAHWGQVRPFVLERPEQFRVPPPPPMSSDAYTAAFDEVRAYGGDGVTTPTIRTSEESEIGIYWAYDGLPSLCAPPRLYNQIAVAIATARGTGALGLLRLLALVNVAMSDEGIAGWDSKYFYGVWRPVTGIREADAGTGPTRAGDGNPATRGDTTFMPFGAPSSNQSGPNFTPPFPAYPSGHAGFGGALFQVLRRFYGRDDIAFTFVSDELNGRTVDNQGKVRPLQPRSSGRCPRPKRRTGRAASTWASTGPSTRRRGLPKGGGSPTSFSIACTYRCAEAGAKVGDEAGRTATGPDPVAWVDLRPDDLGAGGTHQGAGRREEGKHPGAAPWKSVTGSTTANLVPCLRDPEIHGDSHPLVNDPPRVDHRPAKIARPEPAV